MNHIQDIHIYIYIPIKQIPKGRIVVLLDLLKGVPTSLIIDKCNPQIESSTICLGGGGGRFLGEERFHRGIWYFLNGSDVTILN